MCDAYAQRIEHFFTYPANSLSHDFSRYYLIQCKAVPLHSPRIDLFQQGKDLISVHWHDFAKATYLFSRLLCSFGGSPATGRNALNDLIKTQESVERAVAVHSFAVQACVVTEIIVQMWRHAPSESHLKMWCVNAKCAGLCLKIGDLDCFDMDGNVQMQ